MQQIFPHRARGAAPATLAAVAFALLVACAMPCLAQSPASAKPLQVTLSTTQSQATEPFPLRVTLNFHNAGNRTLWLYRPVSGAGLVRGNPGGSTLAIHLEPAASSADLRLSGSAAVHRHLPENPQLGAQLRSTPSSATIPAIGTVLRIAGFPHPELLAIEPGGNAAENVVVNASPSKVKSSAGPAPLWGAYTMSIAYSANYPNGDELRRSCGVDLWSGSISSNPVEVTLQPPNASAQGTISGKVVDRQGLMEAGILVSLTDNNERLVTQFVTGFDGGFRFEHLPFGRYWVTVRRLGADHDTSFFEHADLSGAQPDAQMKLIMLNQEEYEAKQLLHKPVLFLVANGAGSPVADAELKILWSNGPVLENTKAVTDQRGLAVINLIPGSNYVTVTKHHCPKVDQLANVAPGGGIDGFSITFNCEKR